MTDDYETELLRRVLKAAEALAEDQGRTQVVILLRRCLLRLEVKMDDNCH